MSQARPWFRAGRGWYITLKGNQLPLGVPDKDNELGAWLAFQEILARLKGQDPAHPAQTVAQAVARFLEERKATAGDDTIARYARRLKRLTNVFGDKLLSETTAAMIEGDSKSLAGIWSNTERAQYLCTVETFLRWAGRPHKFRKPPKASAGSACLISTEYHERILCVANGDFRQIVRILWLTGCRPQESAGIEAEMVDWSAGVVRLVDHKTAHLGKQRILFLCPESLAILKKQHEKYKTGLLFRGQRGRRLSRAAFVMRFTRISKRIGRRVTAYGYRHSYATRALEKGIADAQVAALLGHTGTAMLFKHYSHLIESARVLREVAAKINGGS